jgi:Tol biopolymer transport system component
MKLKTIFLAAIFALILYSISTAQYFGMNKVQYEKFYWRYIQSEHFDVYFYDGGYDIARFTAEVAESSYVYLKEDFSYDLSDRIVIIIYKSHNHFQQTNVTFSYLDEGIGGFTELFKNRVVLPFEGSYSQFRHVIAHELVHAVMNDMLYGGSIQSLITGSVAQVPLWFAEGLAEYGALRWDTRLDMVVRDATITGYLPPIEFLDYFPYQGGASVFRYIAQKYGPEKIGEILNKLKGSFRFEGAFRSALGIDIKDLTEEWQREMKREYWPDIADRKEPNEIAKALTDHREDRSYINLSPALSPQGDKLVFLSNKGRKMSIYLMDVIEGKVIKRLIAGETDVNFEELHFLEPGFGWSPDGRKITLAAKAGETDALYIYNLEDESYEQYRFDLDGIFSTAWSPKGNEIAFIGDKDGASDIYIFSIETKQISNITNDVFSDKEPSWSPDGERIIFTSDRGSYVNEIYTPSNFEMHLHNFENDDIYIVDRDGTNMIRVTDSETLDRSPIFAPDSNMIAYASEQNGISNIYLHNLETNESWPVTNLITGAFQLSWDKQAQKLAFSSFYRGGWDIYLLKNPLELERVELSQSQYFKRLASGEDLYVSKKEEKPEEELPEGEEAPLVTDFSKYVFADMGRRPTERRGKITLNESDYKLEDGEYRINRYKIKFTPDIINGAAGYNTFFGFQGYTQILLSDMLGNHKIFIGTNLVFDLRNSNISAQYWYLPNRIDYGFGAFHISNFFRTRNEGLIRFRNYGINISASRPFNKFTRVDFSLTWFNVNLEYLQVLLAPQRVKTILPGISLVHDQSEWGMTGPANGVRYSLSALISPRYSSDGLEFQTFKFDYRRYFKIATNYSFAMRFAGGASLGRDAQDFFIGGVSNWINPIFRGGILVRDIEDVFFSEFITPLRGAAYYERAGTKFGLLNLEMRFPLIPYLQLGLPPIRLGNIQGALFTDIGSAWNETGKWRGFADNRLKDIVAGYGIGARIFFLGFLLRFDVAWQYDIETTSKPVYYWSLGADF